MSGDYEGKTNIQIAEEAERDLNSYSAKVGHPAGDAPRVNHGHNAPKTGASDSTLESGVDERVRDKFPGADVTYGSAASGAGDNREIPLSEGGDINPTTGKLYKARDYEGAGGPETKAALHKEANPGADDVRDNIR